MGDVIWLWRRGNGKFCPFMWWASRANELRCLSLPLPEHDNMVGNQPTGSGAAGPYMKLLKHGLSLVALLQSLNYQSQIIFSSLRGHMKVLEEIDAPFDNVQATGDNTRLLATSSERSK